MNKEHRREIQNQVGFGTVGKSDESGRVRVLLRPTLRGWRLVLEDENDGAAVVISPHAIADLQAALQRALDYDKARRCKQAVIIREG